MDLAAAGALERALTRLHAGAGALAHIEVPTLFAGVVDRSSAARQVQRVLTDAEAAVQALGQVGIDSAPLESAKTAVRILEHAAFDQIALRNVGRGLVDRVDAIRSNDQVLDATTRAVLERPWDDLAGDELRTIASLVDRDSPAVASLPRTLTDLPDAVTTLRGAADGDAVAVDRLAAYQDAFRVARMTSAERAAQFDALVARDDSLDAADSLRLASLAGDPQIAASIGDAPALVALARGGSDDAMRAALDRARFSVHIERASDTAAGAMLDELMSRPGERLTPREWGRLNQLLQDARVQTLRTVPTDEPQLKSLTQVSDDFANERYPWDARVQRYFDRYAVSRLDDDALARDIDQLLVERDGASLTAAEWSRLSLLLDDPRSTSVAANPVPGLKDLRQIARDMANASYDWDQRIGAHLEQHLMSRLDDDAAIARYTELVGRDPDTLEPEDWARLAGQALDPRVADRVPQQATDLPDFVAAALAQAHDPTPGGGAARLYLERAAVANLPDAEVAAAFSSMVERPASTLEAGDWARLSVLVGDERVAARVPATMPGLKPFEQITRDMAQSAYAYDGRIQGYFERARLAGMDVDAVTGEFDELMSRAGQDLTPDEWARVYAITTDPRMADAVPGKLEDLKPLHEIAADFAGSKYDWDARVQGYFERHSIARLDADQVRAEFDAFMAREGSTLSREEWSRLGALLDDARVKEIAPPEMTGLKPLDTIASDFAAGSFGWDHSVQGYFERYKVASLDEPMLRDEITAAFTRPASELTASDWARLGALLDDRRVADLVPSDVKGLKSLKQIVADMSAEAYAYDPRIQRYFDRVQLLGLDDAGLGQRITDLMQLPGESLSKEQWSQLAELLALDRSTSVTKWPAQVDGLKPLEQIASELAAELYPYDARVDQYFAGWAMRNDPAYVARFEAAIDALAASSASAEQRAMVIAHPSELDQLIAGRPDAERLAIAMAMLDNDATASSRSVKDTLVAIRDSLGARDGATGQVAELVAQTRELVDRNISRLEGRTPEGAVRGYSNHPDYAEIGRLRANLQLIERLEAGATTGAGAADQAAPTAASGIDSGDLLTW